MHQQNKHIMASENIKIPVKGYVKKVLIGLYGAEPIHAGMYTAIGRELQEAYSFLPADELWAEVAMPGEQLQVAIPQQLARHYNRWKTYRLIDLGTMFEKTCQLLMMQHITAQVRCKVSITTALDDFYAMYHIEEDELPRETAIKYYNRHRQERWKIR